MKNEHVIHLFALSCTLLSCPVIGGSVGRYKEGGLRWARSESWSGAGGQAGGRTDCH